MIARAEASLHLKILQRPLAHETHLLGIDPIQNKLRILRRAEILPQKGILLPDRGDHFGIGLDRGDAGDAHLIVIGGEISELDLGIGGDLAGLLINGEIGDIDREIIIDLHGRDGTDAGLSLGIDGGEHGKLRLADHGVGEFVEAVGIDGFGTGFHGEKRSGRVA